MQNYFKHFILTIFFTFFIILGLFAQQNELPVLGLDNNLCNGMYYSHYYPKSVNGNQFLISAEYAYGTVWKKNGIYDSVLMNYDVVNNEVILKTTTQLGAVKVISMSLFKLDSFELYHRIFVVDLESDNYQNIYQKISYQNLEIRKYFSKELLLRTKLDESQYYFSKVIKEVYFYDSKSLYKVSTRRQFLKAIDENKKKEVKKYIKKKPYKYSKISDLGYLDLLKFINTFKDE